jgi:glycosyltransferase involved in cell wall biosynthesis
MIAKRLRVQICNERLISRFGVDRLLLLAAKHFEANDLEVSFRCLRYDPGLIDPARADVRVISVPTGLDIARTERYVTDFLLETWLKQKPDVLLIGGWPFFEIGARASSVGVRSIFIDAGAVPHDDLESHALSVQLELRRVRRTFLPYIDVILPISEFVRDSQTVKDRGSGDGVKAVLLGSDHLNLVRSTRPFTESSQVTLLKESRQSGCHLILNLGRFEGIGYKNSRQFFDLIKELRNRGKNALGLILGKSDEIDLPEELRGFIEFLGSPDDHDLVSIMKLVELGVSMSLWEGFNLPLVEMQNLGKPALAFNVGAHPEVIAHPWQLCRDVGDMATKAITILEGNKVFEDVVKPRLLKFSSRLPWSDTLAAWLQVVQEASGHTGDRDSPGCRLLLVDVTNSSLDPANSGVIRVTRQLTRWLLDDERFEMLLVRWDHSSKSYVMILNEDSHLSSYGGPHDVIGPMCRSISPEVMLDKLCFARDPKTTAPITMLFSEVVLDGSMDDRLRWLRHRGLLSSAILYDMIPIYHKEFCSPDVVAGFPSYVRSIASMNHCIAISEVSASEFVRFCLEKHLKRAPKVEVLWLPSQFASSPRVRESTGKTNEIRILCVSTIEPRKNHKRLIDAFSRLVGRRLDLTLKLVLVGNAYSGRQDLIEFIEQKIDEDIPIEWLGVLDDDELISQYERSYFTVYPSLVEGFGIPIVESLWLARPCICSGGGVMGELAEGGGCLTVDVTDVGALTKALELLATDEALHKQLAFQAINRELLSWGDYARRVGSKLAGIADFKSTTSPSGDLVTGKQVDISPIEILFD